MINSIDCVHARQFLLSTGASNLKFGEGLEVTKVNNGKTFLTKFGTRKSLGISDNFSFMYNSVSKTTWSDGK